MSRRPGPARRALALGWACAVLTIAAVADAAPAAADNCGTVTDCFPSAKGLLAALAAVLIVAGVLAIVVGGGGLLGLLAAGRFEGGAGGLLGLAGGGVLAEAGALVTAEALATGVAAGTALTGTGILLSEAADGPGGSSGSGSSSGRGPSGDGPTTPSGQPDPAAAPEGTPTRISSQMDAETQRSLIRENESAQTLARDGYKVEQNPAPRPNGKAPDYRIEGEYFDNYAPGTDNVRNVWDVVKGKVESGQAERVVLNLDDTELSETALREQFSNWPIEGLKEVFTIRGGIVTRFFP